MKLFQTTKSLLVPLEKDSFKLEKDIQQLVEANLETLFGFQLVSSEFKVGEFRIDTLAYDESSNAFVIIEYKRGSSYSVVDQGYSYLSTMVNNKAEFILEYNEKTGNALKRNGVDWASSRVVFVAPSFNSYQRNSINFSGIPFELWEIRKFEKGLVALDRLESSSSENIEKLVSKDDQSVISKVNSEVKTTTLEQHEKAMDDSQRKLWGALKERLRQLGGDGFYPQKNYICFKNEGTGVCFIGFRKKQLNIEFARGNLKPDGATSKGFFTLDDPKKMAAEKDRKIGNMRRGTYELRMKDLNELDYVMFLIEQKFKSLS
jgi:predicted transport protein